MTIDNECADKTALQDAHHLFQEASQRLKANSQYLPAIAYFCRMPVHKLDIDAFLELAAQHPLLDVRSPGEYQHAHIPGAHSFPLFTDEERRVVGTVYKQQSREQAIKIGLDYFGPKMRRMVEEAEAITAPGQSKIILVHCWRGGMRSAAIAWLLDLYGFQVYSLTGGYKRYRQWILKQFTLEWPFSVIGGFTGSGKTELLQQLAPQQAIIDLEALAAHKGSAFGNLGMPAQPSQEMFENKLGMALNSHQGAHRIWLEDESQRIGDINIPQPLWQTIRKAPLYFVNIPFDERLQHVVSWYGKQDKEKMLHAMVRIRKRLGPLETKTAVNFLIEDNITESFRVLLTYYDKWYSKSLQSRPEPRTQHTFIDCLKVDPIRNAAELLQYVHPPETINPQHV